MSNPTTSRAFTVGKINDVWTQQITNVSVDDLGEGDVLIAVEYSCINYKDGLATSEKGRVARIDPLIAGVDLAGTVIESSSPEFVVGTKVIAHGYDIGVAHNGGYSALARIPAQWLVALPAGMTTRTAIYTASSGKSSHGIGRVPDGSAATVEVIVEKATRNVFDINFLHHHLNT